METWKLTQGILLCLSNSRNWLYWNYISKCTVKSQYRNTVLHFSNTDSVNFYKRNLLTAYLFPCSRGQRRFCTLLFVFNVCARAEGIFLTFIQIHYLIIIRPRVRRATALVAVTISMAVKANFSSSSASSSSCSPCSLASSLSRIFIRSLDYISAIFLVYYFFPIWAPRSFKHPLILITIALFNVLKYNIL